MATPDIERLLADYPFGLLTQEEQDQLFKAAHHDRDLFARLVEYDILRDSLADPNYRASLAGAFAAQVVPQPQVAPSLWQRIRSSFWLPVGAVGVATAGLAVFLMMPGPNSLTETTIAARLPIDQALSEMASEFVPKGFGTRLELDRPGDNPSYRIGDRLRVTFEVDKDSHVVIFEERRGSASIRLFPNKFITSARVRSGDPVTIPPAGQGEMILDGPPGTRTVKMLIFPSDFDPLSPGQDLSSVKPEIIERTFTVTGGGDQ